MMRNMRQESDKALASLLSPDQRKRLDQIVLQAHGPMVVTKDEIQQKLYLQPNQRQQIAMIVQGMESAQNQSRDRMRQLFMQARQAPPDAGNSGDDDGDNSNRRGRGGRGGFQMTDEMRSQMEQMRTQGENLEKETIQKLGKVLTSRQHKSFSSMRGEPFDFALLTVALGQGGRGGPFGGGGPPGGPQRGPAAGGDANTDADANTGESTEAEAETNLPVRRRVPGN